MGADSGFQALLMSSMSLSATSMKVSTIQKLGLEDNFSSDLCQLHGTFFLPAVFGCLFSLCASVGCWDQAQ